MNHVVTKKETDILLIFLLIWQQMELDQILLLLKEVLLLLELLLMLQDMIKVNDHHWVEEVIYRINHKKGASIREMYLKFLKDPILQTSSKFKFLNRWTNLNI